MIKPTIADAGVIAAGLSAADQWHEWTIEQMRHLAPPFLTCEAVLTEAAFLMRHSSGGALDVVRMVENGLLETAFNLDTSEAANIAALMDKYADVPMSFADACLVRMSEQNDSAQVFTVDSDFRIYRKHGKKAIPLIIPPPK